MRALRGLYHAYRPHSSSKRDQLRGFSPARGRLLADVDPALEDVSGEPGIDDCRATLHRRSQLGRERILPRVERDQSGGRVGANPATAWGSPLGITMP